MAITLTALFVVLNAVVVTMIAAASNDQAMIVNHTITAEQRVVTDEVYVSLVGGTVLHVAAIVVAIARYLFPSGGNRHIQ